MAKGITYQELTQLILQLSQKKRSGTLFLRNIDHQSGIIFFSAGTIIGVTCGSIRGHAAIAALRDAGHLTFRFEEGKPMPVRQDLSSPEETLREFGIEVEIPLVGETTAVVTPPPPPPAAPSSAPPSAPPPRTGKKPTNGNAPNGATLLREFCPQQLIRLILTEEMSKHLGPAGFAVVEDCEERVGGLDSRTQVDTVVRQLGEELADTGEQAEFERNVHQRIASLFTKEACALITVELLECIGPLARDACQRAITRQGGTISSPNELEELIGRLVQEIPDPKEAKTFQIHVHRALSHLSLGSEGR